MKKLMLTICLMVSLLAIGCSHPHTYDMESNNIYIMGGVSKDAATLEVGGSTASQNRNTLLAFGVTNFWDTTNALAVTGKYGIEVSKDSGFFATAIAGIVSRDKIVLEYGPKSKEDPTIVEFESADLELDVLYGVGLSYFPTNSSMIFSLDYDNQREITGGIGWHWKL